MMEVSVKVSVRVNRRCHGSYTTELLPWMLYEDDNSRFWVHYGLIILGFSLAVVTFFVQNLSPAPYGKHESSEANWGPMIPQKLGHILSDAIPGVIMFLLVFFLYGQSRDYINYAFLVLWQLHYIQRGFLHPLMMRYRSKKVALGITVGGFFPNCLFHFLNADFIGNSIFETNYYYDPRFIVGVLLYLIGYIINRWADFRLRSLRDTKGCTGYYIPTGGLFEVVSCPNYFGELLEWLGWTVATWSLAGLVWMLFAAATFIPRSKHNHSWYKQQFEMYPPSRKALIPFIY